MSRRSTAIILLLAFGSGAAALVYELVFFRVLGLVFGVAIHAVAAVVASFLGGLGLGAWLGGCLVRRVSSPWRAVAGIEFGIALFGIAFPFAFRAFGSAIARALPDGLSAASPLYATIAFVASFALLLWPTVLMGATFPLLGSIVCAGHEDVGRRVGLLYGVNTLGAACGALLAAFVALPHLGLLGTSHLAAGLNFLVAITALVLAGREPVRSGEPADDEPAATAPRAWRPLLLAAFLVGCASIALQVLGTRVVVALLGGSVYSFAAVLAVFLVGIGLGGTFGGGWLAARRRPVAALALACIAMAAALGVGLALLRWSAGEGDVLRGARNLDLPPDTTLLGFASAVVWFAALAFLPFTFLSGTFLPAAARWLRGRAVPRGLGALYAVNTVGAICGSVAGGFLLLPWTGLRLGLLVAAALTACAGIVLWSAARAAGEGPRAAGAGALLVVAAGALFVGLRPGESPDELVGVRTISYVEDAVAAVKVEEHDAPGEDMAVRSLRVNGRVEASSFFIDRRLQSILGFIPTLLHRDPRRVLSIALGTGMSAGALAVASTGSAEIVEISPGVIASCHLFDAWNGNVDRRANVTIVRDDGRSFVARSDDTYDVISADPIHPSLAGSAYLFTLEYYRLARSRLNDGGLMSQWIPLYQLSTEDIAGITRTFLEVFPHASAWITGYDMVLLGSTRPLEVDAENVRFRMQAEPERAMLRAVAVYDVEDLLGCYVAGPETLARLASLAKEPITDEHSWLEFTAPRSVFRGYATDVLTLLAQNDDVVPLTASTPDGLRQAIVATNRSLREAALRFVDTARTGAYAAARDEYTDTIRHGFSSDR